MKANKGKVKQVRQSGVKIHKLRLKGHLGGMVLGYRRLEMNIFTKRAVNRGLLVVSVPIIFT